MEDINAIKVYIKNNYPNVAIIDNDDCLLITNDVKNCKTYKKLENKLVDKLNAKEIDKYLTEFKFKSRKIFTDLSKFHKFDEYKDLREQFSKYYPLDKIYPEIVSIEWIWEHDNKTEILIDIESYDNNGLYGLIFKNGEIMYINKNNDLIIQNNIDEELTKRTKTFRHIRFFECDCDYADNYYSKEKHMHQYCLGIIDNMINNTEYFEKEEKVSNDSKISNCTEDEDENEQYELEVVVYDLENKIYKDIRYGFLVKEIDEDVCCYKKVVNGQEIELSDTDKKICKSLLITYRKF